MIFLNEYFQSIAEVSKLGFPNTSDIRIPNEYLDNQKFILFRTCHSYGDWVLISAIPRLLKQKYPNCIVVIPSPKCISNYFSPNNWHHKHENPFNNVIEIFKNNPYVDGMIDELPEGMPVYHDHFRIYNEKNLAIPIAQQILKFWQFTDEEMEDCEPELYWSDEEKKIGDFIISKYFGNNDFGFLFIDDTFFLTISEIVDDMPRRRNLIQNEINKHNLNWLYFSGNYDFTYNIGFDKKAINVKELQISLRVQNYIKSKSKVLIGHQGGYGSDCMSRYTKCYVVPLTRNQVNEHVVLKTTYID